VNIQGTFTIGAGALFTHHQYLTTFSGSQNQILINNGAIGTASNTFYNWTLDKAGWHAHIGGTSNTFTVAAAGVLRLLNGVLNDGGKNVNVLGNMVNSASHTSGAARASRWPGHPTKL
jgi:hypothetical protein